MLKVQATFCGSDTTSASARNLANSARTRASLSAALSPASLMPRSATGTGRRRRTVAPQGVDRIAIDRDEFGAGAGAGLAQLLDAVACVQPRIVAEPRARFQVLRQPLVGRVLDQMLDGEDALVDLRIGLHGVAAVDEHGGLVVQHDRGAGRAGEAGEPGEPLFARRQIFVLLAVGARHDEAVEPAALEFGAQGRDAGRALARVRSNRRRSGTGLQTWPAL